MKHLIRGEVVQKRGGKSVDNVDSLLYGEVPKVMREMRVKRKSTCYIQNVLMLSFHDAILLRCFNT